MRQKLHSSVLILLLVALFGGGLQQQFLPAALAQLPGSEQMDPDEAGSEETLNAQLWEYMKRTPYSRAKIYLAALGHGARDHGAAPAENELPTGWTLAPVGTQVEAGRLPCEAVPYAGGLVVLNNGYYGTGGDSPEVTVLDPLGTVSRTLQFPSLFPSAIVCADGDLYISGGISKQIYRLNSKFETVKTYTVDGYVGGLTAIDATHFAVASLVTAATPADFSKGNFGVGKITIINTLTGAAERSADIGYFPYAIVLNGGKIFASLLGEDRVLVIDALTLKPLHTVLVGKKPQNMTLDSGGDRLYVVNSGSDTVSIIDTHADAVIATLQMQTGKTEFGAAPVSCALDAANNRLFVAMANANEIAVMDLKSGRRIGAVPTGWYPTKVIVDRDRLVVLNGKGVRARRPNVNGPQPAPNRGGPQYVLTLLKGTVETVPLNDVSGHLAEWTRVADSSSPRTGIGKAVKQPIKYVFYIVRENRTYDQIMGDLAKANGDANLTLFGREITPNGHNIAEQFVTLDNYFADGEISVLGHSFTTSGYASPFLEWLGNAAYSGRYNGYPFGMVPAATSPAYIWDALDKKGVDYRVYGENYYLYTRAYDILKTILGPDSEAARKFYAQMMKLASVTDRGAAFYNFAVKYYGKADTPAAAYALLDNQAFLSEFSRFLCGDDTLIPLILIRDDLKAAFSTYLAHYPFNYRSWDLAVSDLDRARVWKEDFEKQVNSGHVASLQYIWLPNDHTGGTNKAFLPPDQLVSQNDAALGFMLETISHSPVWKQSLLLVTEDDAQNGPDHVDATRTVALAAGPGVKRGAVISDRYDQLSLLRTIGLLLGLQPISQNDALAVPMYSIFAPKSNWSPYTAVAPSHLNAADLLKFTELQAPTPAKH